MCATTKAGSQKAEALAELAQVLGCKVESVAIRLNALGLAATCNRCGGGGRYSWCAMYGDRCFGCGGRGYGLPARITRKLIEEARAKVAAGGLNEYLAELRANAECKKQGEQLIAEYAALADGEAQAVAAAGIANPGWTTGTLRGFAVRTATHGFYQRADAARIQMACARTDEDRVKWRTIFTRWWNEMLSAVHYADGTTHEVINLDGHRGVRARTEAEQRQHDEIELQSKARLLAVCGELKVKHGAY